MFRHSIIIDRLYFRLVSAVKLHTIDRRTAKCAEHACQIIRIDDMILKILGTYIIVFI